MPTAAIPHSVSAVAVTFGSAKKPSTWVEPSLALAVRQHSRLENTRSAEPNACLTRRNGACASATFMRLTSPVMMSLSTCVNPRRYSQSTLSVDDGVEAWNEERLDRNDGCHVLDGDHLLHHRVEWRAPDLAGACKEVDPDQEVVALGDLLAIDLRRRGKDIDRFIPIF